MSRTKSRYQPPDASMVKEAPVGDLLRHRSGSNGGQAVLEFAKDQPRAGGDRVWYCGDTGILDGRCVAIVGSREVSPEGVARAQRLAAELVDAGVAVVSGLARGVDTVALEAAVSQGGRVVAVLGTPMDKATPISNAKLQEAIYRDHLLVSQFEFGSRVYPANFPRRNRLMAALSDATVIVEASETSGTIHQAAECARRGRWLFLLESLVAKRQWARDFLKSYEKARALGATQELVDLI